MENNVMYRLEQKIDEILQRVANLKTENEQLKQQLVEATGLKDVLQAKERELGELNELLAVQDAERAEIRAKVEALVAKLEG